MKKLKQIFFTCFLFLLFVNNLEAQKYEVHIKGEVIGVTGTGRERCKNRSGGLNQFRIKYKGQGTEDGILIKSFDNGLKQFEKFDFTTITPEGLEIENVIAKSSLFRYTTGKGCRPKRRTTDFTGASSGCVIKTINTRDGLGRKSRNRTTEIIYTVSVKPVIEFLRENELEDNIGFNDMLTVYATEGFNTSFYNWQWQFYGDDINQWNDVHSLGSSPHILKFQPNKNLVKDDIGKTIVFRIISCENQFSESISYVIKNSAPHIMNSRAFPVSCYDSQDGKIALKFDRPLEAGDNLNISIVDKSKPLAGFNDDGRPKYDVVKSFNNISLDRANSIVLTGLPPSENEFRIDIIGGYNGSSYYTGSSNHSIDFRISKPSPVEFSVDRVVNVWCNNGESVSNNDGEIHIRAWGGNNGTFEYAIVGENLTEEWLPFSNRFTHTINNLYPGNYDIKVRKNVLNGENYCVVKQQVIVNGKIELGSEITENETIAQPDSPLQLTYEDYKEPTAFSFTNGSITAKVSGGTIFNNNTYAFVWVNSNGTPVQGASTSTRFVEGQGYFITLNNIPAGTYNLTITDKNYSEAEINKGCTITNSAFILKEPPALNLAITETHFISCNNANENGDSFSDGELTAIASGGVPLDIFDNGGLPYYYTWTKKDKNEVWQVLTGETDRKLSGISEGEYAVNIEDKNGIVVGIYINNELSIRTAIEETIEQPLLLESSYKKQDVFCFGGNDGAINLTVNGGTPPFTYAWSNGSISQDISKLSFGTYTVTITDARGCRSIQSIEITQPEELIASAFTFKQPTAFGHTNGWVETTISGGTQFLDGSYAFEWRNENGDLLNNQINQTVNNVNNQYTIRLENIGKGKYYLVITDANYNLATNKKGCGILNLKTFNLDEPAPLKINIQETKPISCNQVNTYGNPSADGILIANAKGGVLFSPGLPYIYTWKRKNENTGLWEVLTNQTDSIASNLNAGEYAVNIEDKNGIVLGEYVNNILVEDDDVTYTLKEPDLLQISFSKRDVFCYDGFDGWAEVIIEGGTPPYKILWNNGDETLRTTKLASGNYEAIVTDSRGCEVIRDIEIKEPITPIQIDYNTYGRPSSIGASDAWIEANITGGTPLDNSSYVYEWTDKEGTILNSQTTTDVVNNNGLINYRIRLNEIVAGTYYLTIKDKNYEIADTNSGCTIIYSDFIIHEPIEATIEILTPISCNQNNEFLDPYSNGELIVHVEGGVPFSSGSPYNYSWKKQGNNGVWQFLNDQDSNTISNLSTGYYALNVEDSRGNSIGIYQGDLLIQETDSLFHFKEPELLELEVTSTPISCSAGNDGTATVLISGGISDYNIEWSNGETTPTIRNLTSGTYFVYITDNRGCKATSKVKINHPGNINVEIEKNSPKCYQENNGSIAVNVTGGTSPYTYLWNTGETTPTINNLGAELYKLQIIDDEDCHVFIDVLLEDPIAVPIDLGENRTICLDQNLLLDIAIDDDGATYLWESDNGFTSTSPSVELVESGVYKATITTSEGCIGYDEIEVKVSDKPIEAHFVLSTQVFAREEILLVNISDPIGDNVEWTLPEGVNLIYDTKEKIIISFDEAGEYDIKLRSHQGDCYADFSKKIIVKEPTELLSVGEKNNTFIEEFIVYPNPSDGHFKVKLSLSEEATISMKVISLITSDVMSSKREGANTQFLLDYNLDHLPPGVYLLLLETPKGDQIRKLIFN